MVEWKKGDEPRCPVCGTILVQSEPNRWYCPFEEGIDSEREGEGAEEVRRGELKNGETISVTFAIKIG